MTDTVTVPRELLREIFETADMHANHTWVLLRLRGAHTCAEDVRRSRANIAELRKAAYWTNKESPGANRGFSLAGDAILCVGQ